MKYTIFIRPLLKPHVAYAESKLHTTKVRLKRSPISYNISISCRDIKMILFNASSGELMLNPIAFKWRPNLSG